MIRAAYHYSKSAVLIELSETVQWSFLNVVLQPLCTKSGVTVKATVEAYVEIAFSPPSSIICKTH